MAEAHKEPTKDAPKAPIPAPKKSKSDDDDEAGAMPVAPPKQKMLATALSRSIVIAAIVASIAVVTSGLLSQRYEVIAAPNSANSFIYRLDRLTGGIEFCGPQQCTDVGIKAAKE